MKKRVVSIFFAILSAFFVTGTVSSTTSYAAEQTNSFFTIEYHEDENAEASADKTVVDYGVPTKILKASQLGYSKPGKAFAGWIAYRESDDKWYLTDSTGSSGWKKLEDGKLPEGCSYYIYKDGNTVAKTAKTGIVHLYGQWKDNIYTIIYHADDNSIASEKTTVVEYGKATNIFKASELGFAKDRKTFTGWRVYRSIDDSWCLRNPSGKSEWKHIENGNLPEGYSYYIYKDGVSVSSTAKSGEVHLYGQWKDNGYTVLYHADEESAASDKTTYVEYGKGTNILIVSELGFAKDRKTFTGWRVYRSIDDSWCLRNPSGKSEWKHIENGELPSGYSYYLYKDGVSVSSTAKSGEVHLYGQWKDNGYTVLYHADEESAASDKTTYVEYGKGTNILKATELGFAKDRKTFTGWRVYRSIDDSWCLRNPSGKSEWKHIENGNLPEGYSYYIYKDGVSVSSTAKSGEVHLYGQWKDNGYTIIYHKFEGSEPSDMTTFVDYGVSTKTYTPDELGFVQKGNLFKGWIAYRDIDDKWYIKDASGKVSWQRLDNGELPEGSEFYLYKSGISVAKTATGGNVHLYGIWSESSVNVHDYGADGSDELSDWSSIQKCLNYGKDNDEHIEVHLNAGTYYIDKALTIYSNTSLILDENAEIVRTDQSKLLLMSETDGETGGYGQAHDITIQGGIWNGNVNDTTIWSACLMSFKHASGITLENFKIKEFCSRHMIGLAGVENVTVRNVTFSDQYEFTGEDNNHEHYYLEYDGTEGFNKEKSFMNMEALHIDYVSEDGSSENAPPIDGTVNKNILVENCTFENLFTAIGSHYTDDGTSKGSGYIVRNNRFSNIKYTSVHICNYDNIDVYENNAENVGELIRVNKTAGNIHDNNVVLRESSQSAIDTLKISGIYVYGNSDTAIYGNTIENSPAQAVRITQASKGSVDNNTITGSADSGICIYDASHLSSVSGNVISLSGKYGITVFEANVDALDNNNVSDIGNNGILINESAAVSSVSNNKISTTGYHGISIYGGVCGSVNGNEIEGIKEYGIAVSNNGAVDIMKGNKLTDITRTGIYVSDTGDKDSKVLSLTENIINGTQAHGIWYRSSHVNITDNMISNTVGYGIQVITSVCSEGDRGLVRGNAISNTGNEAQSYAGLSLKESQNIDISYNEVSDCIKHGIWSNGSANCVYEGNTLFGNTGYGMYIQAGENISVIRNTSRDNGTKEMYVKNDTSGNYSENIFGIKGITIKDNSKFISF